MRHMKFMGVLVTSLSIGAAATLAARDARAWGCGAGPYETDTETGNTNRGEEDLDNGAYFEAEGEISRAWKHMHDARPSYDTTPLIQRAVRVMALAMVRSGGAAPADKGWDQNDSAKNVEWGLSRLRMIAEKQPSDRASTDLGEALALVSGHEDEARTVLEKLYAKDKIATPEGWAALAALRLRANETNEGYVALVRCHTTVVEASFRCSLPKVGQSEGGSTPGAVAHK